MNLSNLKMNNSEEKSQHCRASRENDSSKIPAVAHDGNLWNLRFLKILNSKFGKVKGASRMSLGGFSGMKVSSHAGINSSEFGFVDSSSVVSTWNWSGPGRNIYRTSFESKRPLGINFNHFIPTQIELIKGINYSYSFIKIGDFGAKKYQVSQRAGSCRPKYRRRTTFQTLKLNTFERNNSADKKSYSKKVVAALRAKVIRVIHVAIFSQFRIQPIFQLARG